MKVLKKIGIILGILLLVFIILGIFMPKDVQVNYSREMDAPANYLYNLTHDLKSANTWNPWLAEDPETVLTYGVKSAGEGASYSWQSKKLGNGHVTYTKTDPYKRIDADLLFDDMDTSRYFFLFEPISEKSTNVTWTMNSRMSFPYNVFGPFYKYMIRSSYKKGLKHLEEIAEERFEDKVYNGFQIEESEEDEKDFVMNRDVVAFADIQKFYTQNLGAIFQKVQDEGLTMKGMPSALYFKYDETQQTTDMATAIPVTKETNVKGLSSLHIDEKDAVVVEYYGSYDDIGKAHTAIDAYMLDRNLLMDPPVIEEYVTDPLKEKDPAKWLTRVVYYYTKANQ
ncbi:MAG: SRPBCC family protein [Saprospiraceae bacterium]|nr:SRPBCC family protein [Saprospiraceae bacterium]